ncbi:MAG: BTAD domain-containing putative transcriptional regulator, partial [Gemmatimonadales bacterium]
MIQFHTLGVLDLRTADGRELRSVLQQPKRVGVLAYLAVASPRRYHRRDSLLALFWPELDQEHARAALRRALYFLRTELGSAAIGGRGDEEVGVAGEALWCDAVAFDEAISAGNADAALGLYRGTLLDGLHVAGASSEFQDWLDRERTRLRGSAAGAATSLAGTAEFEGRLDEAAGWARRALELEPTDESSLQRLLSLLDRSGDRSAAIRAYDEFARRLAQDLELEPSAETRRVIESLRSRPHPLPAAASPTAMAISHGTIAVLPFAMRGGASFAYLGEGMVDLLATRLDGAGEIRTVDPRALLHALRRGGPLAAESLGPEDGRNLAARFGAGRYLLGSILEAGGRLQVSASLYSLGGDVVASVQASAAGEAGVFELVDELARQLLGAQRVGSGTRITHLAGLTTGSLDALKAYLRGERELRAGRYFDAMDEFQAAVEADASFALAYYRLAAAAAGCALVEVAREVSDQGFDHRTRLAPHDQLLFSAQRAWLHGAVTEAESLYGTITGKALAMRALRAFAGENRAAMAEIARELQGARALTVAIAFADVTL